MIKRIGWSLLFALVFLAAWRVAGVLMDLVLLILLIITLVVCRYWPFRAKR